MSNNLFSSLTFVFCLVLATNFSFAQAPSILVNLDKSQSFCAGADLNFNLNIEASGAEPLHYQWYKNQSPIDQATSPSLNILIESASDADAGMYHCLVSNAEGSIASNKCKLIIDASVPENLSITVDNNIICLGSKAVLIPKYDEGIASLKWYKNEEYIESGGVIDKAKIKDSGSYYYTASNSCGSASSSSVSIEVIDKPIINQNLTNLDLCEGNDLTLTAVVEGSYLSYKWFKDNALLSNQNGQDLILSGISYPHSSFYNFEVTNLCASLSSNSVSVNVKTPPKIQGQPINTDVCQGESAVLRISANSNIEMSYQWYKMPEELIEGATQTNLSVDVQEEARYFCRVTNECLSVYSDTVSVGVKQKPKFVSQPLGASLCEGSSHNMAIKVNGEAPIKLEWLWNDANINMPNVSGTKDYLLKFEELTQAHEGKYKCKATNECGTDFSEEVELKINYKPYFTSHPVSQKVCHDGSLTLEVLCSGSEPIELAWKKEDKQQVFSTDNNYTIESVDLESAGNYYCEISNSCGSVKSNLAEISVIPIPEISKNPVSIETCIGEPVEMNIEVSKEDNTFVYLWYKNGMAVSSQTNPSMFYEQAQINHAGNYYCRVENECGYKVSSNAELIVNDIPRITHHPISTTLCEKQDLILEFEVNDTQFNAQWYHKNQPIEGAITNKLHIVNISPDKAGNYYCVVSNNCGNNTTKSVNVTVNELPDLDLGEDIDVCEGSPLTIGPLSGSFMTYNWNDGLSTSPSLEVQLGGRFILEVTGSNSCSAKDTIVVTFHPYHQITFPEKDIISCGAYELNAGSGAYSYSWSVENHHSSSLIVLESGNYSVTTTGDSFGCESSKSVNVEIKEAIDFSLGDDIIASVKSDVEIGVEPIFSSYLWNTGFTGPKLTVSGNLYGLGEHEFKLKVVAESGCEKADDIIITFVVDDSISENNVNSVDVYPNPATDYIIIDNLDVNIYEINLINALGQRVFKSLVNANRYILELDRYERCFYLLQIIDENNNIINKKIQIL